MMSFTKNLNNTEGQKARKILFLLIGFISVFSMLASSGGTVSICPGSGERCDITTGDGEQIQSEKDKDKGSIIVIYN
jgi:hypothetical protein